MKMISGMVAAPCRGIPSFIKSSCNSALCRTFYTEHDFDFFISFPKRLEIFDHYTGLGIIFQMSMIRSNPLQVEGQTCSAHLKSWKKQPHSLSHKTQSFSDQNLKSEKIFFSKSVI